MWFRKRQPPKPGFEELAQALNQLQFSPTAGRFYEIMSGGVMWEDEKGKVPFSIIGWLRMAVAYRTSVMLGKPRAEYEQTWNDLKRLAPNWPGFRPERCEPTPELVEFILKKQKNTNKGIDRLLATAQGNWKPLSGKKE